jgi:hypothetical protein
MERENLSDGAGAVSGLPPKLIPEEGAAPGLASPNLFSTLHQRAQANPPLSTVPAGIIVPALPQRSPPLLLTTAACGGL